MDISELLCGAIKSRKVISFSYENRTRIVEPFTLGEHKESKNLVLSGFLIGGYSESGNSPMWRLYNVNKIDNLIITSLRAENWRPLYNPIDSRMRRINCGC